MMLHSWNQFYTRGLSVAAELMGKRHTFAFGGAQVQIRLPRAEQVNKDGLSNDIVSIRAWHGAVPVDYTVYRADVVVKLGSSVDLDPAVLKVHPNAYDLIPKSQQELLEAEVVSHQSVAARAFEYWISVMRWTADDYRIGRREIHGAATGWSTCLREEDTETRVWLGTHHLQVEGYRTFSMEAWSDAQKKLTENMQVPIHHTLKYEAEEFLEHGDYRRSLVDTCIACETYLRQCVLAALPPNVGAEVRRFVNDGSISQYINHFFPPLLDSSAMAHYKAKNATKDQLLSLVDKRNRVMHSGDATGATHENCVRFLKVAQELFCLPLKQP